MRVNGLNPAKNLHVEWCAPHTCCRLVNHIAIHHFSSCDDVMKSIYQSSPPGEPCTLYSSRLVPVIPFSPLLVSRVFELEEKVSRKAKQKLNNTFAFKWNHRITVAPLKWMDMWLIRSSSTKKTKLNKNDKESMLMSIAQWAVCICCYHSLFKGHIHRTIFCSSVCREIWVDGSDANKVKLLTLWKRSVDRKRFSKWYFNLAPLHRCR